jgi:hypothetical protein
MTGAVGIWKVSLRLVQIVLTRWAMAEYDTISLRELAARLGEPESNFPGRAEAAAIIGMKPTSLSNKKDSGPAFYRSTNAPTGGVCWYPRRYVVEYAQARRAKTAYKGPVGELEWPQVADGRDDAVPVHLIVALVEKWKRRDLYRRAQKVMNKPFGIDPELKDELRMFGEPRSGTHLDAFARAAHDPDASVRREIFQAMDDQDKFIERTASGLFAEQGMSIPSQHPSRHVIEQMLYEAWFEVVGAERRWRELDYSGMPNEPPD